MEQQIDDLKSVHERHIQKLKDLHKAELDELTRSLETSRLNSTKLVEEKAALEDEIEGMRTEVEMLRQSFDLVQERLRRVLVDQDDLVKMVKLIEQQQSGGQSERKSVNKNQSSQQNNTSGSNTGNSDGTSYALIDIEKRLKGLEQQDSSTIAALHALKYFKKLDASDPLHLCRLLEIPFCPDRSFSLSNSLLTSISVHMSSDQVETKSFREYPVYLLLLDEIIKLKRDSNDLCKLFLKTSKGKSKMIAEITKMIGEKKEGEEKRSVLKWLIDGGQNEIVNQEEMSVQKLFTTFLSTFK